MIQPTTYAASYRFDNFYLDARNRQLWRDEADRVAVEQRNGSLMELGGKTRAARVLTAPGIEHLPNLGQIGRRGWRAVLGHRTPPGRAVGFPPHTRRFKAPSPSLLVAG